MSYTADRAPAGRARRPIIPATLRIRLDNVSFRYGRRAPWAVERMWLELDRRPTVIIGRGGAGKSTLLRLMARRLAPLTGTVLVTGRVGFAAHPTVPLPRFSVEQQVRYASWLAGTPKTDVAAAAARALDLTQLADLARQPARRLSDGELARLGIACALSASSELLLLDDPWASLDPIARRCVTTVLESLAKAGLGLVVTSPTASGVGRPFQRLIMLDGGHLRFDGTPEAFVAGPPQRAAVTELARVIDGPESRPYAGGHWVEHAVDRSEQRTFEVC